MASIEIFIHGVPIGHQIYDVNGNRDSYLDSFYGVSVSYPNSSFIVETKVLGNIITCYYTYFKSGISNKDGRVGSYFAMTLKSSIFIPEIKSLYQVLDTIYNQKVKGYLITNSGTPQYLDADFSKKGKEINEVIVQALKLFSFKGLTLDDSFIANANPALTIHPSRLGQINVVETYKRVEKLIVSPSAPTLSEENRIKEFQTKINFIKQETEGRYKAQTSKLEVELMNTHEERLMMRKKCDDLSNELSSVKAELERSRNDALGWKKESERHLLDYNRLVVKNKDNTELVNTGKSTELCQAGLSRTAGG